MKKNNLLLSICIPTFNRAEILCRTIEKLLSLEAFDSEVELIISDNASTDNTNIIVNNILSKYEDKQIVYHRNNTNVKDLNFYVALTLGTGKYLKLFNDYTYFNNEMLILIKKYIRDFENKSANLMFYNNLRVKGMKVGEALDIYSLNEFQKIVNNKVTWISNFGCWKKDLIDIEKLKADPKLQLLQMEWAFHLVVNRKYTKIINSTYNCIPLELGKRTPYNFFVPHVVNYYKIIENYKNNGEISVSTICYDKHRVLSDFVGYKIIEYLIIKNDSDFELKDSWKIIFSHFYNIPYLYFLLAKGGLMKFKSFIKKINK